MSSIKELRGKAISNIIWKLAERVGAQMVSFIIQLILARILIPEEFGTIAIVNVFIAIGNVFISNGLGTSLIQKKDADELDFSTVFYFNILLSVSLYGLLYLFTPLIAKLYSNKELVWVIRVLGLQLLLSGVKTVQQAFVARRLQFRLFFWATFIGTVISGFVGIALAYSGAGIWALVAQHLTNSAIDMIMLFFVTKWHPKLLFSIQRLKPMIAYGWKLLAGALVNTVYDNLRSLIIGGKYSSADLAYFNRGQQIPDLIYDNTAVTIESVLFPVMSKVQDDKEALRSLTRRFIRVCSYIMSPLLIGVAVTADTMVRVLLTDKWLLAVPYVRIYCIVRMLGPMQIANMQVIKAVGRSDISLKVEVIKKTVGIAILLISMRYGVLWIALSNILYSLIVLMINAYPTNKLIDYSYRMQLIDMLPNLAASVAMGIVVFLIGFINVGDWITLITQIVVGIVSYWFLTKAFKLDSLAYLMDILRPFIPKTIIKREG